MFLLLFFKVVLTAIQLKPNASLQSPVRCLHVYCNTCVNLFNTFYFIGLRLADWALQVVALGLEVFASAGCILYLTSVRYCLNDPSAQKAQGCLATSGYLLWLAG